MILDWCNPDMPYSVRDRIAALLLECGGAMDREHLLTLLSQCVQRSRFDEVLAGMRQRQYLDTIFLAGHRVIYLLSGDGISYAKQVTGTTSRFRSVQGRVSHCRAHNDVLMRCVTEFGLSGWAWYGALEAADHLVTMRQKEGHSAIEIKRTMPTPSALVRTASGIWWLQVDLNASARMVHDNCRNYIKTLDTLSSDVRRVLYVGRTPERTRWLKAAIKSDPRVSIQAYTLEQVVGVLSGSKEPQDTRVTTH